MPYNYQISEEAEADIYESYKWYESQQSKLGEKFLDSLAAAKEAISANPATYRIVYKKKVRSFLTKGFPYLILYIINGNKIDVISVFNVRQHQKKWKKRV